MNESSNALTSVKKTISLDNLFIFREPEMSLNETLLDFFMFESRA